MYKHILLLSIMLLLFNITTTKAQYILEAGIWDTTWNPDGTLLAVANSGGHVYIYDISGALVHTLSGHDQRATSVTWSPNGEIVASGGYDSFIRFWDVDTGELLHEMRTFLDPVSDLAWQPNGTYLAIAGFDTLQIWDTATYEPVTEGATGNFIDIEWSPDGSIFAFGSINSAGIGTVDGNQLDGGSFLIDGEVIYARTRSVAWNSTGTQIVTINLSNGVYTSPSNGVYIWDANTLELVIVLIQNDEPFSDALFVGENNARVIAITTEGNTYTFDANTGEILEMTPENTYLWSLAWNPEHDLLAIGGSSNPLSTDLDTDAMATGFLSLRTINLE